MIKVKERKKRRERKKRLEVVKMSDKKAIRIIAFSGKKNDWRQWSQKFMAVANRRGYKDYVEGTKKISSSSSEEERGKNTAAYNNMLLATTDDRYDWLMKI